jgi:hypothetical protein
MFQVATACFSCRPPNLNSSKLIPFAVKITEVFPEIMQFDTNSENQNYPGASKSETILF